MYLIKNLKEARFMAIALCVALIMLMACATVAFAAVRPIVKDAQGITLNDKGSMLIGSDFDVFVEPQENAVLYYAFNSANINRVIMTGYFVGAPGNPRGSHFGPPFIPGIPVITITDPIGNGIPLGSGHKITIPNPTETTVLYVWAVANGVASPTFSYTFSPELMIRGGYGNIFVNGGQSTVNESIDIFLTDGPTNAEFRYAFNALTVQVFYDGADNSPRGSYFDGPLVSGALSAIRFMSAPVGGDGKITVPDPTVHGVQNLKIAAAVNGSETFIYEHTFAPSQYTVTFVDWDGTVLGEQPVTHGGLVTAPAVPEREGYIHTGWLLNGEEFDIGGAITADMTLVANWVLAPVTSIRINAPSIVTVPRGEEYQFDVILNDGAIGINVIWTIADPSVGIVDETGKVTIFDRIANVRLTATDSVSGLSHSIVLRVAS